MTCWRGFQEIVCTSCQDYEELRTEARLEETTSISSEVGALAVSTCMSGRQGEGHIENRVRIRWPGVLEPMTRIKMSTGEGRVGCTASPDYSGPKLSKCAVTQV